MTDVHVYVTNPPEKDVPALEDLEEVLKELDYVSGVEVDPIGSVVAVSFEGGRDEREEVERAIEETGYDISRLSVRSTPTEQDRLSSAGRACGQPRSCRCGSR